MEKSGLGSGSTFVFVQMSGNELMVPSDRNGLCFLPGDITDPKSNILFNLLL